MPLLRFLLYLLLLSSSLCLNSAELKVTVLHTSDIHARLEPDQAGRLLAIIAREKQRAGGPDHTLLIDTGDLIQGSYLGAFTRGMIGMAYLNAASYQAWIPGNHDLEFGLNDLLRCRRAFTGVTLAANLSIAKPAIPFSAWQIFTINQVKVAVIGLTYPFTQQMQPGTAPTIRIDNFVDTADRIMPEVMAAKPDLIILAVHYSILQSYTGGANSLFVLAGRYPQINLILGGHTHQIVPGRQVGSSATYSESGKHAEGVMRTEIIWDSVSRSVVNTSTRFLPLQEAGRALPCPKQLTEPAMAAQTAGKRIIGRLSWQTGKLTDDNRSSLSNLYILAALSSAKADFAFLNPPNLSRLPEGEITERDLFQLAPFEDELIVLSLTLPEISAIIKEQQGNDRKKSFVRTWTVPRRLNREYGEKNIYQVVFSSFALAQAKQKQPELYRLSQLPDRRRHTGITIRDALRQYLQGNSPLSVSPDIQQ